MDNLSLIKSTYEGVNSQENARNTAAALADDARWTEAAGFPYAGTYVGFDAIVEVPVDQLLDTTVGEVHGDDCPLSGAPRTTGHAGAAGSPSCSVDFAATATGRELRR